MLTYKNGRHNFLYNRTLQITIWMNTFLNSSEHEYTSKSFKKLTNSLFTNLKKVKKILYKNIKIPNLYLCIVLKFGDSKNSP
jgi:hypothetical protein